MNLIWANFTFLQNCPCQIWSYRKSFSNPLKNTTLHFLFQIETLVYRQRHPLRKCLVQIDACQKTFGRQRRCEYYVFQYLLALLFFLCHNRIVKSSLWAMMHCNCTDIAYTRLPSQSSLGNVILFVLYWIGRCWTRYSLFMVQWRESRNLIIKGSWYVKYYNMFLSLIRRSV